MARLHVTLRPERYQATRVVTGRYENEDTTLRLVIDAPCLPRYVERDELLASSRGEYVGSEITWDVVGYYGCYWLLSLAEYECHIEY